MAIRPVRLASIKKGLPHAFVVMPFGRKQGRDGSWIDFNSIYQDLIKPVLEEAGFELFRADEESVSGDILTDMFQELLLADLVLADLSIDNANVFYELGVRHALRKRGLIHGALRTRSQSLTHAPRDRLWQERIRVAERQKQIGDVLLLTEEE